MSFPHRCYEKASALEPTLADPYTGLGNALKAKGKVDEALVLDPSRARSAAE